MGILLEIFTGKLTIGISHEILTGNLPTGIEHKIQKGKQPKGISNANQTWKQPVGIDLTWDFHNKVTHRVFAWVFDSEATLSFHMGF